MVRLLATHDRDRARVIDGRVIDSDPHTVYLRTLDGVAVTIRRAADTYYVKDGQAMLDAPLLQEGERASVIAVRQDDGSFLARVIAVTTR